MFRGLPLPGLHTVEVIGIYVYNSMQPLITLIVMVVQEKWAYPANSGGTCHVCFHQSCNIWSFHPHRWDILQESKICVRSNYGINLGGFTFLPLLCMFVCVCVCVYFHTLPTCWVFLALNSCKSFTWQFIVFTLTTRW